MDIDQNIIIRRKKQEILLMIGVRKKYHYLPVTNLSGLLQGNSSDHSGDFYSLNCFNSYNSKNQLKEHEEICNKHNSFCMVIKHSGWSIFIRPSFNEKENKLYYYRGKDCIEDLYKKLKERAMEIINYEKKKI